VSKAWIGVRNFVEKVIVFMNSSVILISSSVKRAGNVSISFMK